MIIFISYSSKDRPIVEELAADLNASGGYEVWFDQELTGGHEWWKRILENIRQCDVFLFALTPNGLDSYPCQLEYDYAYRLHKRILPVQLADGVRFETLPSQLTKLQAVDYRQRDKPHYAALIKALNKLPPAPAMPKVRIPEPETPISPLNRLRDQIDQPSLSTEQQILIIVDLRDFLEKAETSEAAHELLKRLEMRQDLTAKALREIERVRASLPVAPPRYPILTPRIFDGHIDGVDSAVFSPDGRYILTGSSDGRACLWEADSGREIRCFEGHSGWVQAVVFSPDGRYILTGGADQTARLWDASNGRELRRFKGHWHFVNSVAISPDGGFFVSGGEDSTVRLWDIASGSEVRLFGGHSDAVIAVAISPDGRSILTGGADNIACLWETSSGREIRRFFGHSGIVSGVAFSPSGRYIVTGSEDTTARLWQLDKVRSIRRFEGHTERVSSVNFSPDGRYVLTGSFDRNACLWRVNTQRSIRHFEGHADKVYSAVFSPDGRYILTASNDKTARLWESGLDENGKFIG